MNIYVVYKPNDKPNTYKFSLFFSLNTLIIRYIVNIINARFNELNGSPGLVLFIDGHRTNRRDPLRMLRRHGLQHLPESPGAPPRAAPEGDR